jgi:hypothetical protein
VRGHHEDDDENDDDGELIWRLNDVVESTEARVIMSTPRALLAYVLKVYSNDVTERGGGHMAHRTRFVF